MFEQSEQEDLRSSRMILEHELRAAIRIIGHLVAEEGGTIKVPHSLLGTDYRVSVHSDSLNDTITLTSRVAP